MGYNIPLSNSIPMVAAGGRGARPYTHTAYNRHALDRKSEKERARTKRRARKWNRKKKKRNTKERRER